MPRIQIADCIIEKEGKILMLARAFPPNKGKLDLMGGFVDSGETPEKGAVREAKEESGFEVEIIRKLGTYDYFDRQEKTMHIYVTKAVGGKLAESVEGSLIWREPGSITEEELAFPQVHARALKDFMNEKHSR